MSDMQVILLEKIRNLGNLGDIVEIKPGYARNYLLPQGKAVTATAKNIAEVNERRTQLEQKAEELLVAAQQRATQLSGVKITINALASDEGKLYGSVGANEIAKAMNVAGHEVEKREINLPNGSLHNTGEFDIILQVHSDVIAQIKIEIVAIK